MGMHALSSAPLESGARFFAGAQGKWAGEQWLAAHRRGEDISPNHLRVADLLRKDEFLFFDRELIYEAKIRLRGVADLLSAGLVKRIPNGLAKTVYEWTKVTDMDPATVSLDAVTRSENDRVEFELDGLPLPITHKDFYLNIRELKASQSMGFESLDTTHVRVAGRKVSETTEEMLFLGGKTFAGRTIYGYTTHPDRLTMTFGTGGTWGTAGKTGEQKLVDVQSAITLLESNRMYGPYWVYVGSDASVPLGSDFKAQSDKTTRSRLLEIDGVQKITVADKMPTGEMVVVQATQDVVQMVEGEPLQTVQWDLYGGMQINFKAFQILVPNIRVDADGRSGVVHVSGV